MKTASLKQYEIADNIELYCNRNTPIPEVIRVIQLIFGDKATLKDIKAAYNYLGW